MNRRTLPLGIAWRYFRAPKSHGAVNAIAVISVVGVAVATAAIVIVLSIFNGFRHHLNQRLDSLTADISVTPAKGKTFESGDSLVKLLKSMPEVYEAMAEVTDNALAIADSREMPITLKGVDPALFARITSIDSLLLDGESVATYGRKPENGVEMKKASVSVGVAQRLGIYNTGEPLFIFAPKRKGRVNMANPASSFLTDSLSAASVFRSMQTEFDENTVICDISIARDLFQYDGEATAIQIKALPGTDLQRLRTSIKERLGEGYVVKDRLEQQEVNFRMVAIEKWITFILLTFILVIASFNIISTLCMIILDKGNSLNTLSNIGLNKRTLGAIFWWESLLVTFCGALSGLVAGVVVSLLQERYGIIKLAGDPENLIIRAYPVKVEWLDLGITLIPIVVIGLVAAWISYSFARGRLKPAR